VSFTLPRHLAPLVLQNKKVLYDLLFRTSAETLLEVARDPQHLGAEIGFFSVLHSWTQKLEFHPHVHCVVPAGGLSAEFLRRFLLHLLPEGFVRIRNFGFLAIVNVPSLCHFAFSCSVRHHNASPRSPPPVPVIFGLAPKCGGPMRIIERLTAAEIQLRSPPAPDTIAA
jgi:hypothetical protein